MVYLSSFEEVRVGMFCLLMEVVLLMISREVKLFKERMVEVMMSL